MASNMAIWESQSHLVFLAKGKQNLPISLLTLTTATLPQRPPPLALSFLHPLGQHVPLLL